MKEKAEEVDKTESPASPRELEAALTTPDAAHHGLAVLSPSAVGQQRLPENKVL